MPTWPPDEVTILIIAIVVLGVGLLLMYVHLHGGLTAVKADTAKLFNHAATPAAPTIHVAAPVIDQAQLDAAVAKALAARSPPPPPWSKP